MFGIFLVVAIVLFLAWQIKRRREQGAREQARLEQEAEDRRKQLEELKKQVNYVVPNEVIPARTTVTDRMVRVVSVENQHAPWKDEQDQKTYPQSIDQVVGRIALVRLAVQEPLRHERLASKDDLRAISFLIEPGKRAVTINMDLTRGVGGFIRQGDYVDILGTFDLPGGKTVTKAILQRVKILIVDRTYAKAKTPQELAAEQEELTEDEKKKKSSPTKAIGKLGMVTFELTPDEAEKLILADNRIRLTLALRNPGDPVDEEDEYEVVRDVDVFTDGSETALPPQEPEGKVELILGANKQTQKVGVR